MLLEIDFQQLFEILLPLQQQLNNYSKLKSDIACVASVSVVLSILFNSLTV